MSHSSWPWTATGHVLPVHIAQLAARHTHIHQKLLTQVRDNSSTLKLSDGWAYRLSCVAPRPGRYHLDDPFRTCLPVRQCLASADGTNREVMLWQEVAEGDKKVSSQVCNVLLIGFTLAATFLRRHPTLLSQLRLQIQTLSMFFFCSLCSLCGYIRRKLGDNANSYLTWQVRAGQSCSCVWQWKYFNGDGRLCHNNSTESHPL